MTQAQAASTPYRPVERRLNDNPALKGLSLIGRNEPLQGESESDSLKGLSLIGQNEAVTGEER